MRKILLKLKTTITKIWKDQVGAGIIVFAISAILTWLWNKIDEKGFTIFKDHIARFIKQETPIWATLLFGLIAYILLLLYRRQTNALIKKELETIKGSLDAEFSERLTNLEKKLIERINKNSSIKSIELDILKLDTKFKKHLITSYDFYDAKPDANIEHMFLCELLDSAMKINDESYGHTDEIEDVLKAIDAYLTKHPNNYTDEHERIYAAIKKVPLNKYDYYLNKIKKRVE